MNSRAEELKKSLEHYQHMLEKCEEQILAHKGRLTSRARRSREFCCDRHKNKYMAIKKRIESIERDLVEELRNDKNVKRVEPLIGGKEIESQKYS